MEHWTRDELRKIIISAAENDDLQLIADLCVNDRDILFHGLIRVSISAKAKSFNVVDRHLDDFKFLMSQEEISRFRKIKSTIDKIDFIREIVVRHYVSSNK